MEKRSLRVTVSPYLRVIAVAVCIFLFKGFAHAEELQLQDLIEKALQSNHEILVAESRWKTATFRIPQAKSLPDPMVMFGYQNEGFRRFTYGKSNDAMFMFSASQMFPFPGKLGLKGEMVSREADSLQASYDASRLKTVAKVKELYYDLFMAYRNIDLIKDRTALFSRIEDAAVARYSSGMGLQQEVLMAQTEKYMLLEKEEMQQQKIQSFEAMINAAIGRDASAPLGRPAEPSLTAYVQSMDELVGAAYANSPEIRSKERMIASAEAKVSMAEKEYYPDFTINATVFPKGGGMEDMWSLTTTINIPLFYKTKQRQAVLEAKSLLSEAAHELEATKIMFSANIRENYSMLKTAEKLMELYRDGLIPRTYQDFESALAGYISGKVEALTVISRLKALLDFETFYWVQFVEREKAAARLEALAGIMESGGR